MITTEKKIVLVTILLVLFGSVAIFAQNVTLSYNLDLSGASTNNKLSWAMGKTKVDDKLDVASGASIGKSTNGLNAIRYDTLETKQAAIPVSLRGLLLFPIAAPITMESDSLTAESVNGVITIRYVHRGTAYQIVTDKKGNFDVLTGASYAKIGSQVAGEFVIDDKYLKSGGKANNMKDLDWSKVTLLPDTKSAKATRWYEGNLKITLKKNILAIKGTLKEKK